MSTLTPQITSVARREAIQIELEATRTAFHATLQRVGDAMWRQSSPDGAWRLGQVLAHTASYVDMVLPMAVKNARAGKNMPSMPDWAAKYVNYQMGRLVARKMNPERLAVKYDAAHARALTLLDGIADGEWTRETTIPIGRLTIEQLFLHHGVHARHHLAEVTGVLDARAPAPAMA